ncbi:MAG: glycoside hydrolase family 2 protein, partial [Clostridia bacterium]|nr:glycoside hydrolase family 2 protein [Clostridia bacterium]
PCSMYDTLIRAGAVPDPYTGENEWIMTPLSDEDTEFSRTVVLPEEMRTADRIFLRFAGIDTLADVFWDGEKLGSTDNMHRAWEFPLDGKAGEGDHSLLLYIHSPTRYIAEMQRKRPLWGVEHAVEGYPHIRKAHSCFGWDWGPKLPDMGIWRDVTLEGHTGGRILNVRYDQCHEEGAVTLSCRAELDTWKPGMTAVWTVTAPDGKVFSMPLTDGKENIRISDPQLWWVRGLGDQPLYRCRVTLYDGEREADSREDRTGLRTLTVSREEDRWGQEFCLINNGVKFFAMGADYIPEDQLLPRCTKEKTLAVLGDCLKANYNFIRVWGGGYYPGSAFYDFCDENGIAVWQDFMFACATYRLTPEFEATVQAEIRDNVIRLRSHPSLAMWCGNNEIETAWVNWGLPEDPEAREDYLKLFEEIIPKILGELDPAAFYWPSSPSSRGGFRDPEGDRAGDCHYWAVWHGFKPIEEFRRYHYRFCSEYGFESLPDMRTVRYFTGQEEPDLCGPVMEAHHKCTGGTEKIMYYLGQMVNYPKDTARLAYCSQLVQADCIRSNVEHMRRARGRCMGSAYWQVNDSNPTISWSSIDYFGRWK